MLRAAVRSPFLPAILCWVLFVAACLWLTRGPLALDTDSSMRLVEVRDLLAGQSWFDTSQWRMNVPYGLPMHWSRLVDAPLALLLIVSHSERFAMTAWPLLLMLAAMLLVARIALVLGGRTAAATASLLLLLAIGVGRLFTPGSIDHHNLQLVLMLAALAAVVDGRPRLAAVTVALGLGVGLESLPYALVAILAAVLWLRDDARKAFAFGATIAAAALLLLFTTTAAAYRTQPACDTYSLFYAVLLAAGGAGLALVARLPRHRLAGCAVLAGVLLGLAALLNPACFAGPYGGLDARMHAIFLARINEAQPVWYFWTMAPSETIAGYGYGLFAFVLGWFAPPGRARAWMLAFAGTALAVATLQIRAVPFAIMFALPGLAAGLVRLTQKRSVVLLAAAVLIGCNPAFSVVGAVIEGPAHLATRMAAFHRQEDCAGPAPVAFLARQPVGRVAALVDQGPAILLGTKDSVIAGPYHRDAAGIEDSFDLFTGRDPQAILKRRGINYLMICRTAPDWNYYRARGGLFAQLTEGQVPGWLQLLGTSGDVVLYRVRNS